MRNASFGPRRAILSTTDFSAGLAVLAGLEVRQSMRTFTVSKSLTPSDGRHTDRLGEKVSVLTDVFRSLAFANVRASKMPEPRL
jgi:hypothetical protein